MLWKYAANLQENTHTEVRFHRKTPVHEACNFIKEETLMQVFSCEFCEISKEHLSYRTNLDGCFWSTQRKLEYYIFSCMKILVFLEVFLKIEVHRIWAFWYFSSKTGCRKYNLAVFAEWCLFLKKHANVLNQTVRIKCFSC